MTRTAKISLIALFALAAVAAGIYVGQKKWSSDPVQPGSSKLLFAQTLPDAEGNPHVLADYRNKIVVLNFWASWCVPCVEEIPEFSALQTEFSGKGVQFIGIGIDSAKNIAEFQKKVPASYPLLVAGATGSELALQFGNTVGGLPYTLVLDRNGGVKASKMGRVKEKELRAWLQSVL